MAIVLQPQFPVPDRSRQPVRILKDESGMIDIGWCEGVLSDGRAFRAEMWAQDHVSSLTIFFSTLGLEALDPEEICALVEQEGLVSFEAGAESYCASDKYVDNSGQELWSVNIVVELISRPSSATPCRSLAIQAIASRTRCSAAGGEREPCRRPPMSAPSRSMSSPPWAPRSALPRWWRRPAANGR